MRKTLVGRQCAELVCPVGEGCIVSVFREQPGAERKTLSQRRRMSQSSRFGDGCVAQRQRLAGKAEKEQDISQNCLRRQLGVEPDLRVSDWWEIGL